MGQRKEIYLKPQSRRGLRSPPGQVVVYFVCDCHEFTSPESCPGTIPLASAGRDGSPERCGSARVRSRCHQRGDPPSPAPRGPRRREAAGWGPRSLGRSRSSPARNLLGERLLSLGVWDIGLPQASARASLPALVPRKRASVRAWGLWCHGCPGVPSPCPMHPTHKAELGSSRALSPTVQLNLTSQ